MRNIKKSSFYLAIGIIYFLLLVFIYSVWIENEDKESDLDAHRLSNTINAILDRNASIANLASNYINQECTPDVIRQLSHYAASNEALRAVSIIKDNKWYCSSLDGTGPVNIPLKENNKPLYIESLERNKVRLYIVFYTFDKGKIAVAFHRTSLDKMIKQAARETNSDIKISLTPLAGDGVIASSEYPFWVQVSHKKSITDFFHSQYITVIFVTLFISSLIALFDIYKKQSPILSIKRAIRNDEMRPYYQPIVEINSKKIIGAEVLVRWIHPQQGMIPPSEFIPAAEQHGLITALTLDLMVKLYKDMVLLRDKYENTLHISINVAPISLQDGDFIDECINFGKKLQNISINGCIEITERQQNQILPEIYYSLHENNMNISLDDFGTGYSNYETIGRTHPSYLKIDRMFVNSIGTQSINESILKNIVAFSNELEIPNIAEGIENEQQHNTLKTLGVKYGQGYLYSHPLPIESFITILENQK